MVVAVPSYRAVDPMAEACEVVACEVASYHVVASCGPYPSLAAGWGHTTLADSDHPTVTDPPCRPGHLAATAHHAPAAASSDLYHATVAAHSAAHPPSVPAAPSCDEVGEVVAAWVGGWGLPTGSPTEASLRPRHHVPVGVGSLVEDVGTRAAAEGRNQACVVAWAVTQLETSGVTSHYFPQSAFSFLFGMV